MKSDYKKYPKPTNNIQEILLHLIVEKNVSIFDFSYLSSFRTRVSDIQIKHGIFLERVFQTKYNKFGNAYSYAVHTLPDSQLEKAKSLYFQLNKQKN